MKQFIFNKIFQRNISFLALFVLYACSSGDSQATIKASFTLVSQDALVNEAIQFKNESTGNIDAVLWDFGDGTTSSQSNPVHSYSKLGTYSVTLKVKNNDTSTESTATNTISVALSNDISGRISLKEKLSTPNGKIMVCAHRATEIDKPENSLVAIQNTIDNKIEMVEIDIRETKDGELVLMHDATIQRTTTGTGNVSSFTLQELKQFNLEKSNGSLTNEKIPTLKEVFDLARGKIYINLDLDEKAPFAKVYDLAKQYGMLKQVQFYTKDNSQIRSMLAKNADLVVLPYIDDEAEFNSFTTSNLSIVHYSDTSFNITMVQKAKDKGIVVYANAYVNTSTTPQSDNNISIDRFIALKGSVVQTDHPEYIKTYLQGKNLN
jgi:glycerophosphoryl diester phosphodiesterase